MRYAELITLYFERSNALQWYWTVYVVVIGGLLGVAAMRRQPDAVAGMLATVLYCAFAYKNLGALHDVTINRLATLEAIHRFDALSVSNTDASGFEEAHRWIEPTLQPPTYEGVRNFHIVCDALTVMTLWSLQWRRWRATRRHEPIPP